MSFSTKSVVFDGLTGYVDMGNSPTFQLEYTDVFSISCWAKTFATVTSTLVAKMDSTTGIGYSLYLNSSGQLEFIFQGASTARHVRTDSSRYNDGGWHHFVITNDGSAVPTIYVDGIAKDTTTVQNDIASSIVVNKSLQIGGYDGTNDLFEGSIDEVSIHDVELTAGEVLDIFGSAQPVDIAALGKYSPLTTSIYIAADTGDRDEGGVFPDPLVTPATGQAFTMGCWFKRSSKTIKSYLVSKCRGPGSTRTWYFYFYDYNSPNIAWSNNNYDLSFVGKTLPFDAFDGNWHHAAITYDGVSVWNGHIYIDGVQYTPNSSGGWSGQAGSAANDGSFVVGGRWDGAGVRDNFYQTNVCHSFLYDKVLSQAEVTALYGGGAPQDLNSIGPTANLKHWCAMGDGCALGASNLPDLSPAGLDGTYVNGESGDFELDVPEKATNIVGWWKMGDGDTYPTISDQINETVFPIIPDLSPSGNNGTATNMEAGDITADVAGGRACTFNGSDEYVTMGNVLNFERTDPFSFSAWIKSVSTANNSIISKFGQLPASPGIDFVFGSTGWLAARLTSNNATGDFIDVNTTGGGTWTAVNDGLWHHVALTWDGNASPGAAGAAIYVDGVLETLHVGTDNLTGSILTTDDFMVGRRAQTFQPQYLDGEIDDCAVYDKELSQAEIEDIYNNGTPDDLSSDSNLVGYWRMGDGATSPTILNEAPNTNYSPLTKAIYLNEGDVLTDQILNIGNPLDSVTQNDPFSACLWVNYDHTAGGNPAILFNKYHAATPRGWYVAEMGGGTLRVYFQWGTAPSGVVYKDFASTGVDNGSWHLLMLTYDGSANVSGIKLYMDGVELTATTTSGTTINNTIADTIAFGVARAPSSGLYYAYVGLVLHCAAWLAELTPAEVLEVYGKGYPQDLLEVGPTTDLAFWHSLGDGSTHANPGGIPDLSGNGHDGAWWDNNGGFSTDVPLVGDGTMTNMDATNFVDGVPGDYSTVSLDFDGVDEFVTMGSVLDFERNQAFSLSGWFRKTAASNGMIVAKQGDTNPEGWGVSIDSLGKASFVMTHTWITNVIAVNSVETGFNDGLWHHIVMTFDGVTYPSSASAVSLYVDGVKLTNNVDYNNLTSNVSNSFALTIGRRIHSSSPLYHDGDIDEVLIYDVKLTSDQVSNLYGFASPVDPTTLDSWSDAVGYWKMGEELPSDGAMTNMASDDLVTNAPKLPGLIGQQINYYLMRGLAATNPAVYNHWTVNGSPDFGGTYADPVYIPPATAYSPLTESIRFNNDTFDERADFGGAYPLVQTTPVSMGAWFRTETNADSYIILRSQASSGNIYGRGLVIRPPNGIWEYHTDNLGNSGYAKVTLPSGVFNDGEWHFIAFAWAGSGGLYFYFDGVEVTNNYSSGGPIPDAAFRPHNSMDALWVSGCFNYLSTFVGGLRGHICHSFVYDKLLSGSEITAIYNGGLPADLSSVGPVGNLVHWCALGNGDAIGTGNLVDLSGGGNDGTFANGESSDFEAEVPYSSNYEVTSFSDITVAASWKVNE